MISFFIILACLLDTLLFYKTFINNNEINISVFHRPIKIIGHRSSELSGFFLNRTKSIHSRAIISN